MLVNSRCCQAALQPGPGRTRFQALLHLVLLGVTRRLSPPPAGPVAVLSIARRLGGFSMIRRVTSLVGGVAMDIPPDTAGYMPSCG